MWTPAAGLEATHDAHPDGCIRRRATGELCYQRKASTGYLRIRVRIRGKAYDLRVHRIIAQTFNPNPDDLPEVNHLDGDKTNCAASNLEWCTRAGNMAHAKAIGLLPEQPGRKAVVAHHPLIGEVRYASKYEAIQAGADRRGLREALKYGWLHHGTYWRWE